MSVTWLLDNQCFDEALPELKDELTRQNTKYINAKYRGFGTSLEIESALPPGDIFVYGSLPFVQRVGLQKDTLTIKSERRSIHTWCNLPQFKCSFYYPRLSPYMLNSEYCFLPYGELATKEEWIFKTFGIDDCIFMRPDSGNKEFTGQVFQKKYWQGYNRVSNTDCQPEDMVVIAKPQNIVEEYRVIIGPGQDYELQRIVTLSRSHQDGKLSPAVMGSFEASHLVDFIHEVLYNICYEPDPFWVMDVALTQDMKYKIIEVNSMSCSGLYCCNLKELIQSIGFYFGADNIAGYKK